MKRLAFCTWGLMSGVAWSTHEEEEEDDDGQGRLPGG